MREENNNLNKPSVEEQNNTPVVNTADKETSSVINVEEVNIKETQEIIDNTPQTQNSNIPSSQPIIIEDKQQNNTVTTNTPQIKDDVVSNMNSSTTIPVQSQVSNSQTSDFDDIKETKNKSPLIALLAVFVLLVAAVIGFYFLYLTPNKIFSKTIDKLSNYSAKGLDVASEFTNKKFKTITSNISLDYNIKSEDQTIKSNINAKSGFDKEKKIIYTQIDGKNAESTQFTLSMLIDKTNKLYLSTDKKFDKGFYYELSSDDAMFDVDSISFDKLGPSMNSITYIVNKSFEAFKNSYDTNRFKKTIELKTINGKKVLTIKLTDSISKNDEAVIGNKMIDIFVGDDKFLESIVNLYGNLMPGLSVETPEKDDIKSMLKEHKVDVKAIDDNDKTNLTLNYSMTGELVYAEISKGDEKTYLEKKDGIYTVTQKSLGYDGHEDTVKYIYDSSKKTFTVKYAEGEFTISCKSADVSDKEYKYDFTMNMTSKDLKFDFDLTSTVKFDANLEEFDVSKCKNSESLTEEEISEYQEAFLGIMPISLPNVIQPMDNANVNSFVLQIKMIISSAQNKITEENINGNVTYSNIPTCKSNGVAVDNEYFSDVSYSITLNKNGKVVSFNASNGKYSYSKTNIQDSFDIDSDDIVKGSSYIEAKCTK